MFRTRRLCRGDVGVGCDASDGGVSGAITEGDGNGVSGGEGDMMMMMTTMTTKTTTTTTTTTTTMMMTAIFPADLRSFNLVPAKVVSVYWW